VRGPVRQLVVEVGGGEEQDEAGDREQQERDGEAHDGRAYRGSAGPSGRIAKLCGVLGRLAAPVLVVAAVFVEAAGLEAVAGYLLVGAVPVAAWTALASFGRLVDLTGRAPGLWQARAETVFGALGTVVLVAAAALRGEALAVASRPALAGSLVLAAAALLALGSLVPELPGVRRAPARGEVAAAAVD
jgi:hypothetical protein